MLLLDGSGDSEGDQTPPATIKSRLYCTQHCNTQEHGYHTLERPGNSPTAS